ncbi:WD40 repeat domain-containing protein [Nonomuraea sp. NPDC049625]|uniref:WD40 repeat domain-containing protein n=1 Tax=Nonomuraea sp. NPDC049625 TaxID=3155775 RepID=UPI003449C5AE
MSESSSSTRTTFSRLTHRLLTRGAAVALAAGLFVAQAPAAMATDLMTDLGEHLSWASDVTTANDKIFISGSDRIVVADSRGSLTGVITDLPGVIGLAAAPDGARLYAALSEANQVAEIDTASLAVTRRIDLKAFACPSPWYLSLSGSRLYVGHGCYAQPGTGGVVSIDVAAPQPEQTQLVTGAYSVPIVGAAGTTLVVGSQGLYPGSFAVYDVSGSGATLRGEINGHDHDFSGLNDLAISSDGSTVFTTYNTPSRYDAWDTTDLTLIRSYGVEPTFTGRSNAVALSPDGASVVGGRWDDTSVGVFDTATGTKTFTYANPDVRLVDKTLVHTGKDVFGVVEGESGRLYLWRVPDVALPMSELTLTAPSSATVLQPLTLTGRLTLSDGSAPGAQPLVVTRRLPDGTRETLPAATTTADGAFTITDTPSVTGAIGYEVLWQGNSAFRLSRASATVNVVKAKSSISLTPPSSATALQPFTLMGQLTLANGSVPGEQRLTVTRDLPTRPVETLPAVTTAADGTFTITDTWPLGGTGKYEVRWPGNALYGQATATLDITVAKAQTELTLSGPERAAAGKELQFSGALTSASRLPSSVLIEVFRTVTNRDGTETVQLPSIQVYGESTFGFTDTPQAGGEHTYTVKWSGGLAHMPAEGSHVVVVGGPLD